jgi:hypothetical protein
MFLALGAVGCSFDSLPASLIAAPHVTLDPDMLPSRLLTDSGEEEMLAAEEAAEAHEGDVLSEEEADPAFAADLGPTGHDAGLAMEEEPLQHSQTKEEETAATLRELCRRLVSSSYYMPSGALQTAMKLLEYLEEAVGTTQPFNPVRGFGSEEQQKGRRKRSWSEVDVDDMPAAEFNKRRERGRPKESNAVFETLRQLLGAAEEGQQPTQQPTQPT